MSVAGVHAMNMFRSRREPRSGLVKIDRIQPAGFRLKPGSAVYAIDGLLWLTQEGHPDDVVLAPGERFDVRQTGLILVSSVDKPASAYVMAGNNVGSRDSLVISPEHLYAVEREARELRRQELARVVRRAGRFFMRLGRSVKGVWRGKRWAVAH